MQRLVSVGDKHHAPKIEILDDYGDGVLFTLETADGTRVIPCFATRAAISKAAAPLGGGQHASILSKQTFFEDLASTLYSTDPTASRIVIEENSIVP